METLGDKLKRIEAAKAQEAAARAAAEAVSAAKAEELRRKSVRDQFETWKRDIISAVDQDKEPLSLQIATAPPKDGRTSWLISASESPDHDLFLDFERWATEQGLEIKTDHADGNGGGGARLTVSSAAK